MYDKNRNCLRRELEDFVEAEAQEFWDEDDNWPTDDEFNAEDEFEAVGENQRPERTLAVSIDFQELLQAARNERGTKHRDIITTQTEHLQTICNIASDDAVDSREDVEKVDEHEADLTSLATVPRFSFVRSLSFSDLQSRTAASETPVRHQLKRAKSMTRVPPTNGEKTVVSNSHSSLSCIQGLLPPGAIKAVVGPSLRASLIVTTETAENKRASIIVAWSMMSHQVSECGKKCYDFRVIPIAGCGENIEVSWATALHLESQIQKCIDSNWLDGASSSHYKRYLDLSNFVVSHQPNWSHMLACAVSESMQDQQRHTSKALDVLGISYGNSLDSFDLFLQYQNQEHPKDENETLRDLENTERNLCLVCFDLIDVEDDPLGVSMLSPCGHRTCPSCWRSYLQSAADNGQGHVLCPAYKCSTKVGLLDAAHLLFFQSDSDCDGEQTEQRHENAAMYERLVRFEMERFATCQLKARPCTSPHCSRFLTSQTEDIGRGWAFSKCLCGMIRCSQCSPAGGPAHPGIDCTTYQKLRDGMDSGKLDSELANVKWVMKFSRRCPNCQFAIEKDGGCNHVRCRQCDYYFCWECGGPGQDCNAYECFRRKKGSEEVLSEHDKGLFRLLSQYRRLRQTEARIKQLGVAINGNRHDEAGHDLLCLESSVHQVMLWLYSFTSVNLMDLKVDSPTDMQNVTCQLELVVHALMLRKFKIKLPPSAASSNMYRKVDGPASPEGSVETNQKKYQSKRKQQSLLQRHRNVADLTSFEALKADYELRALCSASQGEFELMVQDAVQAGIRCLWKISVMPKSDAPARRRRRIRRTKVLESAGGLNPKAKRSNDPWKLGMHRNAQSLSNEDEAVRNRWRRDRARVAQLRDHAMFNAL